MRGLLFTIINIGFSTLLIIILLYLVVLGTGTQSITADRGVRRNNTSNKYKGV